MGQKVNPISMRLGITRTWDSRWYSKRSDYAKLLHEDILIRRHIKKEFYDAGIDRIEIERASNRAKITIHSARPGIIIGPKGAKIEALRNGLEKWTGKQILIQIEEVKRPEMRAQLVAENVSQQLLRRVSFRRAMKRALQSSIDAGAEGVRIGCAGRLAGAEMARRESYRKGRVPLHTLRADIDFGLTEARTKYGAIGIKVWVFRGEVLNRPEVFERRAANR
ncbi:MAG: 30S ribosomal protein S3 [candidate division BRC1 bacterium ADurb.BinA364]|nr:MAG: 30S ribosomal protein S3 [candidate division BRC1 bacterium ADurb.BinA364]